MFELRAFVSRLSVNNDKLNNLMNQSRRDEGVCLANIGKKVKELWFGLKFCENVTQVLYLLESFCHWIRETQKKLVKSLEWFKSILSSRRFCWVSGSHISVGLSAFQRFDKVLCSCVEISTWKAHHNRIFVVAAIVVVTHSHNTKETEMPALSYIVENHSRIKRGREIEKKKQPADKWRAHLMFPASVLNWR